MHLLADGNMIQYNILPSSCVLLLVLISRLVAKCAVVGLLTLSDLYCHVTTVWLAIRGTVVFD